MTMIFIAIFAQGDEDQQINSQLEHLDDSSGFTAVHLEYRRELGLRNIALINGSARSTNEPPGQWIQLGSVPHLCL